MLERTFSSVRYDRSTSMRQFRDHFVTCYLFLIISLRIDFYEKISLKRSYEDFELLYYIVVKIARTAEVSLRWRHEIIRSRSHNSQKKCQLKTSTFIHTIIKSECVNVNYFYHILLHTFFKK